MCTGVARGVVFVPSRGGESNVGVPRSDPGGDLSPPPGAWVGVEAGTPYPTIMLMALEDSTVLEDSLGPMDSIDIVPVAP